MAKLLNVNQAFAFSNLPPLKWVTSWFLAFLDIFTGSRHVELTNRCWQHDGRLILRLDKTSTVIFSREKKAANPLQLGINGKKVMESLGTTVIKSSSNLSSSITKNARQFVSTKTMVARAEKGVAEVIPQITKEIGVEMSKTLPARSCICVGC